MHLHKLCRVGKRNKKRNFGLREESKSRLKSNLFCSIREMKKNTSFTEIKLVQPVSVKKLYYEKYFENNLNSRRKTWDGFNDLINKKSNKQKPIHVIKNPAGNGTICNPGSISNILNSHFASAGFNLASQLPQAARHFSDHYKNTVYRSFSHLSFQLRLNLK